MKKKTVYVCDHCGRYFDDPCEKHEVECLAEKQWIELQQKAAARIGPLQAILLHETTKDPIGAKINGVLLLIETPFTRKSIKALAGATELVSTATKPSKHDDMLIKEVNKILSS